MGKTLQVKYPDLSQTIIKNKKHSRTNISDTTKKKTLSRKQKRKLDPCDTQDGTVSKKSKLGNTLNSGRHEVIVKKNPLFEHAQLNLAYNDDDLFATDELLSSYLFITQFDILFTIYDEVALEGLDGITIEAVFTRLKHAFNSNSFIFNTLISEIIWKIICCNKMINFYLLPQPRNKLGVFDTLENYLEQYGESHDIPVAAMPTIYPFHCITEGESGSCATLNTRVDITEELVNSSKSLIEVVRKYGRRLVIVGNKNMRRNALFDDTADPLLELQPLSYSILERIGRSRRIGEITHGSMSLPNVIKMDSQTFFYYKKKLVDSNLIAEQISYMRLVQADHNKLSSLLHLKRFHNRRMSKKMSMAYRVVNFLKTQPNYRADFLRIKPCLPDIRFKDIRRSKEMKKYIRIHWHVPYRQMYPDAPPHEWQTKSKVERYLFVLELINPFINITASWTDTVLQSSKEDTISNYSGTRAYNVNGVQQIYNYILKKGAVGTGLQEIYSEFDADLYFVKMILRRLVLNNLVEMKRVDVGKQRLISYFPKCLLQNSCTTSHAVKPYAPSKTNSKIMEKLKERTRNHMKTNINVYTKDQQLLDDDLNINSPITPLVVDAKKYKSIACVYFIKRNINNIDNKQNINTKTTLIRNYDLIQTELFVLHNLKMEQISNITVRDINDIIKRKITINIINTLNNLNITDDCIINSCHKYDLATKLILLKSFLDGIDIDNTIFENTTNAKTELEDTNEDIEMDDVTNLQSKLKMKMMRSKEKLNYMGTKPIELFKSDVDGVNVTVEISSLCPLEKYHVKNIENFKTTEQITERVLHRIHIILNAINKYEIITDRHKIIKIIIEQEKSEGYDRKIDRKSLLRLLTKLTESGYIKIYRITYQVSDKIKEDTFVCHPKIHESHPSLMSAIQQTKFKSMAGAHKPDPKPVASAPVEQPPGPSEIVKPIRKKLLPKATKVSLNKKYNKNIGKTYGVKPKLMKMRIFHELLFYMIYEYGGQAVPLSNEEVKDLFKSYHITLTEDDLATMPSIYCKEISWKMFIPPLPEYTGWPNGWALIYDLIIRIPISVLLKLVNVPFDDKEIVENLEHPIRRFYLMKDQSDNVRELVLFGRKYLFEIEQLLSNLTYTGLVQLGPSRFQSKQQGYMYLNRKAMLLDTTTSEPAYHKIYDKHYERIDYEFKDMNDVEAYWSNLHNIAANTNLNSRYMALGKTITLFNCKAKPELIPCLNPKSPEEAIAADTGELPGDRRGAAGLDSSMWCHLPRNWFWVSTSGRGHRQSNNFSRMGIEVEKMEKITEVVEPVSYIDLKKMHKVYLPVRSARLPRIAALKPIKSKSKRNKGKQRTILRRVSSKIARDYYDDLDKAIIKKLAGARVHWSSEEDKIIFLGRVANTFLWPLSTGKQMVPYNVLRDVLHRVLPQISKNKTSRAIQRRLKILLKSDPNYVRLDENASNLIKCEPIRKYLSQFINSYYSQMDDKGYAVRPKDQEITTAFVFLMAYCVPHRNEIEQFLNGNQAQRDYLSPENLQSTASNMVLVDTVASNFNLIKTEEEITRTLIKSVLFSTLCNRHDYMGWAYHLFRMYQRWPDKLIRDSAMEMKHQQSISFVKFSTQIGGFTRSHLPCRMSNNFILTQGTTFSHNTNLEAYKTLQVLKSANRDDPTFLKFTSDILDMKRYGQLFGICETSLFLPLAHMTFKFHIPEHPVKLNPNTENYDKLLEEVAGRYHTFLKKKMEGNQRRKHEKTKTTKNAEQPPTISKQTKSLDNDMEEDDDDIMDDVNDDKTYNNLKSWLNNCMDADKRVRSPSPDFSDTEVNDLRVLAMENGLEIDLSFMNKDQSDDNDDEEIEDLPDDTHTVKELPSVEQMKEEMVKENCPNSVRTVPFITDLVELLNSNLGEDEEYKLDTLKNNLIPEFPYIEDVELESCEELANHFIVEFLENQERLQDIVQKLRTEIIFNEPDMDAEMDFIEKVSLETRELMKNIIEFIRTKGQFGATGPEIQQRFLSIDTPTLLRLITTLKNNSFILQTGSYEITFVHYLYANAWLVDTFPLTTDEEYLLRTEEIDLQKYNQLTENMGKRLGSSQHIKVKLYPWVKLDSTLNVNFLKECLAKVLSHCVEHPKIMMSSLCEKFCYWQPVDLFYLLSILEEIGCLDIMKTDPDDSNDLMSDYRFLSEDGATFLDDFEDIHIEPTSVAMLAAGSFFRFL